MLSEKPIEELMREKAMTNSFIYSDAIKKIRLEYCPRYIGVPENASLQNRSQICDSCTGSTYCQNRD